MRQLFFSIAIIAFCSTILSAQCPSSNREGVHVVQYGQTLYRISQIYNVSIDDLRGWNGMKFNELLSVCQELKIVPSSYTTNSSSPSQEVLVTRSAAPTPITTRQFSGYQRQAGGKHTIQQGETITNIAKLYGYTEERFREFNVLRPGQELAPGSVVLSTDCSCNRVSYADQANGLFEDQWNERLIPQSDNAYYHKKYTDNATIYNNTYTNPYYTPPASSNSSRVGGAATDWGNVSANTGLNQNDIWKRNQDYTNGNFETTRNSSNLNAYNNERAAATYMSNEELDMLGEINLVRSNPRGYIRYVEQYIQDIRSGRAFGSSTTAAYELIDELKRTDPLPVLKPLECLYKAAQQHGQEAVRKGSSDHQGMDGSWPWDRAKRACPQIQDGNENLVGGPASIRETILLLLVDDGISNRGHRKTILNREWRYVACYKSGIVGRMPNSWVQMFGK